MILAADFDAFGDIITSRLIMKRHISLFIISASHAHTNGASSVIIELWERQQHRLWGSRAAALERGPMLGTRAAADQLHINRRQEASRRGTAMSTRGCQNAR